MNNEILLVEDDFELAILVRDYLTKNGFTVDMIHNGTEAVTVIQQTQPDLVILDIMLPDKNGNQVCREIRDFYHGAIIMLTALDDDMDQMLGLELGADDYIIKPVQPRLLLTRIRTILRRMNLGEPANHTVINAGELHIDSGNRLVKVAELRIDLTTAEFELLLLLAQEIGQVVDRNSIVQQLRGFEYDGFDRSIDRRISRLRKKLTSDSGFEFIKTIRGKGYQLCTGEQ